MDRHPSVIVKAADAEDVALVVRVAAETASPLSVRSGGHSLAGHSVVDDALVLDLSGLESLEFDLENRTVWAGAGLTAGELTDAAGAHGLAVGFGDAPTVGVGGITLGGGVGFLTRKHGLTVDSLLAVDMVTADGSLLTGVDEVSHPDLFWALRGGGGNFGVVTRFKFRLHPVDTVVGGLMILPGTPEVITSFVEAAEAAPDDLSTIANLMPAPPMPFLPEEIHGRPVLMALVLFSGELDDSEEALAPIRSTATPLADMVRPMKYPEIYRLFGEEEGPHPVAMEVHSMFVDHFDDTGAKTVLGYLESSTASMAVVQLRVLGGAVARVSEEATAFAHRSRRLMVNVACMYDDPSQEETHERWVRDLVAELSDGTEGVYVNFLGDEGEDRVRAAYPGATWDRLRSVKRRYDPHNLFRLNQNIPPAD
jgi:FAD/FMN-containing dehydrogenase